MSEHVDKHTLLNNMRKGYGQLENLLSSLSAEQMTTPGVNSTWSVKDNIAHLAFWQSYQLERVAALKNNTEPNVPEVFQQNTEDEVNEHVYQMYKDRGLAAVLAEFSATAEQLIQEVQSLTEEDLNRPLPWLDNRPIWPSIVGNSFGHYEEHEQIIQSWLSRSQ
jgi:hypothetical protein